MVIRKCPIMLVIIVTIRIIMGIIMTILHHVQLMKDTVVRDFKFFYIVVSLEWNIWWDISSFHILYYYRTGLRITISQKNVPQRQMAVIMIFIRIMLKIIMIIRALIIIVIMAVNIILKLNIISKIHHWTKMLILE